MTMVKYMLKANSQDSDSVGLNIGDMKIERPLIAQPTASEQLFRVSAAADWTKAVVSLAFYSVNAQGRKTASHATSSILNGSTVLDTSLGSS
jgi:naphtho-gamma-pyrone polyketide synthase